MSHGLCESCYMKCLATQYDEKLDADTAYSMGMAVIYHRKCDRAAGEWPKWAVKLRENIPSAYPLP